MADGLAFIGFGEVGRERFRDINSVSPQRLRIREALGKQTEERKAP